MIQTPIPGFKYNVFMSRHQQEQAATTEMFVLLMSLALPWGSVLTKQAFAMTETVAR